MLERGASDVLVNGQLRLESVCTAQVGVSNLGCLCSLQIFTLVTVTSLSQIFCGQESLVKFVFIARQTWKLDLGSKTD